MSDAERRWLPIVRTLARDVDPRDYLYSAERPAPPGPSRRGERLWAMLTGLVVGVGLCLAVAPWVGYRHVGPEDERALRVVHEVDPDHQVTTDEELARRWGTLAEAYRVMRTAVATAPTGDEYPFLATLARQPGPAVTPGLGRAVVLLANALDLYAEADQGRMIQRLLAIAASMDRPGVIMALGRLADLPPNVRERLFADDGAAFSRLVDLAFAVDDAHGATDAVARRLEAELRADQDRRSTMAARLTAAAQTRGDAARATCARHVRAAETCLARSGSNPPP